MENLKAISTTQARTKANGRDANWLANKRSSHEKVISIIR